MIIAKGLRKEFDGNGSKKVAVQGLDLNIEGGIVGLLGPNGAGKTTTIRMLSTIYRPTAGGAIVAGHDIIEDPLGVRSSIGLSTETPSLYPRLSALQNLHYFGSLFDLSKEERDDRISRYLEQFGLQDVADIRVEKYSKGMKQKLSLIKAILHDPQVLLFDEPWAGLSPDATRDVRNLIRELSGDNRTVLISTHNLAQAEKVVDRLLIIKQGELLVDATPASLRKKHAVKPIISLRMDNRDGLEDALSTMDYVDHVELEGEISKVFVNSFDNTPDLVTHLAKSFRIHDVSEVIPSIEEIYLELVEEEL